MRANPGFAIQTRLIHRSKVEASAHKETCMCLLKKGKNGVAIYIRGFLQKRIWDVHIKCSFNDQVWSGPGESACTPDVGGVAYTQRQRLAQVLEPLGVSSIRVVRETVAFRV